MRGTNHRGDDEKHPRSTGEEKLRVTQINRRKREKGSDRSNGHKRKSFGKVRERKSKSDKGEGKPAYTYG